MRPTTVAVALAGLVALISVGLTGCSSTLGYAAVVNGTVISQSSLNATLADFAKNTKYINDEIVSQGGSFYGGSGAGSYDKTFVAHVLQSMVQEDVIRQALVAHHSLPSADDQNTAKGEMSSSPDFSSFPKAFQTTQIDIQADVDAFVKLQSVNFTPQKVSDFYNANKSHYLSEACVRYILIADMTGGQLDQAASLATADMVSAMLAAGGDFAALAKQYSQDTSTGPNGGVVPGSATDGCLSNSDLQQISSQLPPFAEAVVTQQPNQVGAPIQTSVGDLLIEVTSEVFEPLSAATADIDQNLAGQVLNGLMQKAHVKVNPQFGSFDTQLDSTGAVTGVVPPVVPTFGTTTTSPPLPGAGSGG